MNITKPKISKELIKIDKLIEEIEDNQLSNKKLNDTTLDNLEIYDIEFENMKFT